MPDNTEVAVRKSPFDLTRRGRLFDLLIDGGDLFGMPDWFAADAVPVDISRKDGNVIVRASVPGFDANEIDLRVDADSIAIRAEHKEEHEEKGEEYVRRERRSGYCSRNIALPESIAKDKATAVFKDGVLTITAPAAAASAANKVEIQKA